MSDDDETVQPTRLSFFSEPEVPSAAPTSQYQGIPILMGKAHSPWYGIEPGQPIRIVVPIPASRWQAYKAKHADAWWMRWLVRLRPVRYNEPRTFTGHVQSVDFGGGE